MCRIVFLVFSVALGILACAPEVRYTPEKPVPDNPKDVKNYADVLRTNPEFVELLNDPKLTAITSELGKTVISTTNLPIKSEVIITPKKAWSSWWYPKNKDVLFGDSDSSISKYDSYRRATYRADGKPAPASAVDYEKGMFNPGALSWEGLCDAWALASISFEEPRQDVQVHVGNRDFNFSVADQKALLLKTYEAIDDSNLKIYGQKFSGDANGWIYPDIFPEQFHRFVEVQLFDKKEPFVLDHDPGIEVWNVPVFKANYMIETIPDKPDSVFVRMWIFSAEPTQEDEKNFVGTKEASREYNYVLEGKRNEQGQLVIDTGYWVKGPGGIDSRKNHPDYLIRIIDPANVVRKSWNPEIEVELVDKIIHQN